MIGFAEETGGLIFFKGGLELLFSIRTFGRLMVLFVSFVNLSINEMLAEE
jgi:hypothetical protein